MPVEFDRRSGLDRRNSFENLIRQNINDKFDTFASFKQQKPICTSPLSIIQPVDKVEEINEAIKKKNYFNALTITALMLISMPAHIKEFKNAAKDLFEEKPSKEKLIPEGYHIKASFFRDTLFEPLLKIPYIGEYLDKHDKSLYDYIKLREAIFKKIGKPKEIIANSQITNKTDGELIQAYKLEGGKLSCFVGHVLMKISKINLIIISSLQIPIIYKAFADKDSKENRAIHGAKQILKSVINIPIALLGGAVLGTLFHRKGAASILLATGVGAYMGAKTGEYIEEKIDKI